MKRRHFLQFAAATLVSLGLSPFYLQQQSLKYGRILAQQTRRKRALLVGINDYPKGSIFTNLKGCVTDVDLQHELLIHRFGFSRDDIVTLTNENADRQTILDTFNEFLIKPCQEDDVVVFHFSGHGRRIIDPSPVRSLSRDRGLDPLNSTLVPADDDSLRRQNRTVSDIMGRTLFLLTTALKTPHFTVVLDTCYAGGGIRGNTRVRSAGDDFELRASPEELAYQQDWLAQLGLDPGQFTQRREVGISKGIAIAAAQNNQKAVDASFDQFDAGAFTYLLTQFLWHEAESVESVIANVTLNLQEQSFKQRPLGCVAPLQCNALQPRSQLLPIYFVNPQETESAPAEAVIQAVNGDRATIWLGGSDANSIVTYGPAAEFMPVGKNRAGRVLKVLHRTGLSAEVQLSQLLPTGTELRTKVPLSQLFPEGTLLREAARVIPRNVTLRVGLDPSLSNQAVAAQQAFQQLQLGERFELVLPDTEGSYPKAIHYILSRLGKTYLRFLQVTKTVGRTEQLVPGKIALLSPGIDELIPGSVQDGHLDMGTVLNNLKGTLTTLYAARFLKLAINADPLRGKSLETSPLNVQVQVRLLLENSADPRGCRIPGAYLTLGTGVVEFPLGAVYQFEVTNPSLDRLYLTILDIDQAGEIKPLLPNQLTNSEVETMIQPRSTRIVPELCQGVEFVLMKQIRSEFLVMVSRKPPRQALLALRNERRSSNIPLVDALLADMSGVELNRSTTAQRLRLSTADVAVFSIPFQVV